MPSKKNVIQAFATALFCGIAVFSANCSELRARVELLPESQRNLAGAFFETPFAEALLQKNAQLAALFAPAPLGAPAAQASGALALAAEPETLSDPHQPRTASSASSAAAQSLEKTIAFLGDSFANGYAASAKPFAPQGYKTKDFGRHSTGLTVKSYFDWQAQTEKVCQSEHPEVMVFAFGANDAQDIKTDKGYLRFGTPAWSEEYEKRASRIAQTAKSCSAKFAWLELPPMRDPKYNDKMLVVKAAQAKACSASDACIKPDPVFGECCGNFADSGMVNGKRKPLRASDGIHLSADGYAIYSKKAIGSLFPNP